MNKFLDNIGLAHLWAKLKDYFVKKEEGKGLSTNDFTNELLTKLNGIEAGANKYTHAAHTAAESGFYKVTVDAEGHVSAVTPVAKTDITALGIPAQDTVYTHATHTAYGAGIYKITVDGEGHVTEAVAVTKAELDGIIGTATQQTAGLQSALDKKKLDGVADGAQVNVIEKIKVNGSEQAVTDKGVDIAVPTGSLANKNEVAESDLAAELKAKVNAASEGNHSHENKALLDTYTQTDENLADAVAKKHSHANAEELNKFESGDKEKLDQVVTDLGTEIDRATQAEQAAADAAAEAKRIAEAKQSPATTLQGYGITDAYTKDEVNGLVSSALHYKGSKATYAELPAEGNQVGDVWNIQQADAENGINAGDNVAWNGTSWDVLAGTVDLSAYMLKRDMAALTNDEIDAILAE